MVFLHVYEVEDFDEKASSKYGASHFTSSDYRVKKYPNLTHLDMQDFLSYSLDVENRTTYYLLPYLGAKFTNDYRSERWRPMHINPVSQVAYCRTKMDGNIIDWTKENKIVVGITAKYYKTVPEPARDQLTPLFSDSQYLYFLLDVDPEVLKLFKAGKYSQMIGTEDMFDALSIYFRYHIEVPIRRWTIQECVFRRDLDSTLAEKLSKHLGTPIYKLKELDSKPSLKKETLDMDAIMKDGKIGSLAIKPVKDKLNVYQRRLFNI